MADVPPPLEMKSWNEGHSDIGDWQCPLPHFEIGLNMKAIEKTNFN